MGALAAGPSIRFSFKMSVLASLKFDKVLFDVWKVAFALNETGVCWLEAELE